MSLIKAPLDPVVHCSSLLSAEAMGLIKARTAGVATIEQLSQSVLRNNWYDALSILWCLPLRARSDWLESFIAETHHPIAVFEGAISAYQNNPVKGTLIEVSLPRIFAARLLAKASCCGIRAPLVHEKLMDVYLQVLENLVKKQTGKNIEGEVSRAIPRGDREIVMWAYDAQINEAIRNILLAALSQPAPNPSWAILQSEARTLILINPQLLRDNSLKIALASQNFHL
jgi:hypothetical protein